MRNPAVIMKSLTAVLILLIIPVSLYAADTAKPEKMRLAVMDLNSRGKVSKVTAAAISDLLRSDIVDTGRFVIVERSQMEAIFKEQGLQMTGCTDNSCAVEIGKLVSANKIILGEVNMLNNSTIITVRVVDVAKGVAEFSTSEKTENINEIDKTVKSLVEKLTLRMTGKRPVEETEDVKNIPSGLSIYYSYFKPAKTPFKTYYDSLMGGGLDYYYNFDNYLSVFGGISYLQGSDNLSGKATVSLNNYTIGGRIGFPFYNVVYPYIGAGGIVTWYNERSSASSASFAGYGGEGFAGLAITFGRKFSIWGDYGMSMEKLDDKNKTDISGSTIRGGVMFAF